MQKALSLQWLAKYSIGLVMLCLASAAHAEQKQMGDYTVFYNAFNSSFLSPDVARANGITRSGIVGVLNISIHKTAGDAEMPNAVPANILGTARNRLSQLKDLAFKEVREGDAIYYIASFRFDDKEWVNFDLEIQPEGEGKSVPLTFSQQFFSD